LRPSLKKPFAKRAGGVAQGGGPEFKPQCWKKKKKFRLKCTPRLVFFADKVIDLVVWPLSSFSVNHSTFKRSLGALFG
jgi:hypothetical protein